MKRIQKYVDGIKEELHDAKEYAMCYLESKSSNPGWSKNYKTMAEQELQHANYLHEMAIVEIEELKKQFTPPESMQAAWDKSHKKYIEKAAFIRQMLAM